MSDNSDCLTYADSKSCPEVLLESSEEWDDCTCASSSPNVKLLRRMGRLHMCLILAQRKAAHPYPQKAPKNVLVPLQPSMAQPSLMGNAFALTPGQISWDEASMLMNTASCKNISADEVENFPGAEGDIGSKGVARINCDQLNGAGTSSRTFYSSEELEQKNEAPALHVSLTRIFKATYMLKLKEMDPINFETVLLPMRNLTFNFSSPEFEPMVLSTYDVQTKTLGISLGTVFTSHADVT